MDITASDIYSFYNTKLGQILKRHIRQQINSNINLQGPLSICGYGYTEPYLSFLSKQENENQYVECIPDFLDGSVNQNLNYDQKNIHEYFLPLEPSSTDVVISTHLLELVEKPKSSIEEVWRILKPNGIFIAVVPRRAGLWTRYDNNPFGYGRSYSSMQFRELIKNYMVLDNKKSFIHFPPWNHYLNYKFHPTLEKTGEIIFPFIGGLMVLVCKKIVYATNKKRQNKIPIKNIVTT